MREHSYFDEPGNFRTVRHLTMHGTNFATGQQLGELARERYGTTPEQFRGDPRFARARRAFLQNAYPIQWKRTRGVAAALGIDPNDDRCDLPGLTYLMDVSLPTPGCSGVYYPPATTVSGGGYLGRLAAGPDATTGSCRTTTLWPIAPVIPSCTRIPPDAMRNTCLRATGSRRWSRTTSCTGTTRGRTLPSCP